MRVAAGEGGAMRVASAKGKPVRMSATDMLNQKELERVTGRPAQ